MKTLKVTLLLVFIVVGLATRRHTKPQPEPPAQRQLRHPRSTRRSCRTPNASLKRCANVNSPLTRTRKSNENEPDWYPCTLTDSCPRSPCYANAGGY